MSEPKFTPGPWHVGGGAKGHVIHAVFGKDAGGKQWGPFLAIVEVPSDVEAKEAVANAHLIAAAPELYAALEACVGELRNYERTSTGEVASGVRGAIEDGMAALKKARGE